MKDCDQTSCFMPSISSRIDFYRFDIHVTAGKRRYLRVASKRLSLAPLQAFEGDPSSH